MENNFFKSALPVWIESRDKEWNVTAELCFAAKNLKNATLTLAGATFYQVYLGEKLLHFGPAKKAIGYAGVDVIPLPEVDEGTIYIRVAGYYLGCYNGCITSSFVQAEIEQDGEILAATGHGGFECRIYTPKLQKVMRYSYQRQFSECYDLFRHPIKTRFAVVDQPGVVFRGVAVTMIRRMRMPFVCELISDFRWISEAVQGHGIVPALAKGITAQNSPHREDESDEEPALFKRLEGVGRAGWCESAAGRLYR